MKIVTILFSVILVILVVFVGGYFGVRYYLSTQAGYEFLFVHPTIAKIFGVSPVCSTICLANGGVCGMDGKNYCNQCVAYQNGAGYAHDGACVAGTQDPTAGWKTYTDDINGIQLKYPATFTGVVWNAQVWPPVVSVVDGKETSSQACAGSSPNNAQFSLSGVKQVGSNSFALLESSDVGAGQLYTDYCYVLNANSKNYVIHFVIHSANGCGGGNCGPYCGTANEQACKNFDVQKEVVQPIEQMVATFKFTK